MKRLGRNRGVGGSFRLCFVTLLASNIIMVILCRTIQFEPQSPFDSEKNQHETLVPKDEKYKEVTHEEKSKTTTEVPHEKDDESDSSEEDFCVVGDDDEEDGGEGDDNDDDPCFLPEEDDEEEDGVGDEDDEDDSEDDDCNGHEEDDDDEDIVDVISDHTTKKHGAKPAFPKEQNDIIQYHKYNRKPRGPKILTEKWLIHERIHT